MEFSLLEDSLAKGLHLNAPFIRGSFFVITDPRGKKLQIGALFLTRF